MSEVKNPTQEELAQFKEIELLGKRSEELAREIKITKLAQYLFTEAGYSGNVYKATPELLRRFEYKALEILEVVEEKK